MGIPLRLIPLKRIRVVVYGGSGRMYCCQLGMSDVWPIGMLWSTALERAWKRGGCIWEEESLVWKRGERCTGVVERLLVSFCCSVPRKEKDILEAGMDGRV